MAAVKCDDDSVSPLKKSRDEAASDSDDSDCVITSYTQAAAEKDDVVLVIKSSNLTVMMIYYLFDILELYLKNDPEYYDDNKKLPILERISHDKKCHYSVHNIICLLLHPNLQSSTFACSTVPTFVNDNVSFLINLDALDDSRDVLADDMGSWRNNGVNTTYINVQVSSIKVKNITICSLDDATYSLRQFYWIHSTDNSLKKLTAHVYGEQCTFIVV
uniref:Uncharacterized protein n=1 Tax=Amphimedon queenslandica TaxID=400682 RepID=A0A1X7SXD0_AMPQE